MKLAVITAIFGAYDAVPPIPKGFSEAVLVSDRPIESDWTNVVLSTDLPARFASKLPKFRPDLFTKAEASVWVDASMRDPDDWLFSASKKLLSKHDLVLFKHPERSSVAEEVVASRAVEKYDKFPLEEQLASYKLDGFPDDVGLWAGGVIARIHNLANRELGNEWLVQNARWSIQDQLSLPFIVWNKNLHVGSFAEHQYSGPLRWIHHYGEISLRKNAKLQFKEPTQVRIQLGTAIQLLRARRYVELLSSIKRLASVFLSQIFLTLKETAKKIWIKSRSTAGRLFGLVLTAIRLLAKGNLKDLWLGLKNVTRSRN